MTGGFVECADCARLRQIFSIKTLFFVECATLKFRLFWKILPGAAHYAQLQRRPHRSFSAGHIVASAQVRPGVGPAHVLAPVEGGLRSSQDEVPCSSHRKWPQDERWRQSPQTTRRGHRRLLRKGIDGH